MGTQQLAGFASDAIAVGVESMWVRTGHVDGPVDVGAVEVGRVGRDARVVPRSTFAPSTAWVLVDQCVALGALKVGGGLISSDVLRFPRVVALPVARVVTSDCEPAADL